MNPFVLVALGALAFIAISYGKTAAAGLALDYDITGFQIYKFASDGIKFRVKIKFVNSKASALHVQMVNLKAFVDSVYTKATDGTINISSTGKLIGSCQDDTAFTIEANKISEKYFYCSIGYMNLLTTLGLKVFNYIKNNDSLKPKNVLISGFIKAEGVNIPVTSVVAFS